VLIEVGRWAFQEHLEEDSGGGSKKTGNQQDQMEEFHGCLILQKELQEEEVEEEEEEEENKIVAWHRPHREHSFPYIVICWEVFNEPLPSNALIKSVTILFQKTRWTKVSFSETLCFWKENAPPR
jgi:hypothetical protein